MEDFEKILLDIEVNSTEAIKNITEYRQKVEQLKNQQKELTKEFKNGKVSADDYAKQNEVLTQQIKATNKALQDEQREFQKQVTAVEDAEGSLDQMRKQLANMKKEYAALSKQERESPIGEEMAKSISDLNDELKDSEEKLGDFRRNVGNYQQSIEDALVAQAGLFGQLANASKSTGGIKALFGALVSGLNSATKAAVKFIATPIGAIIAALVGTITLLTQAFKRNEENGQKLNVVFSRITSVLKTVFKALEPVVGFLVDSFVKAFDMAVQGVGKLTSAFEKFLRFIGLNGVADAVRGTADAFGEMDKAAKKLAESEAELTKMQREARKTQLQYQNEAEKLRQQRDDESKSIQERIKLNEELGALLEKQSQAELEIANKQLEVAKLKIQLDGETSENLDALAEAETNIIDIEERIQGQRSEQLMNLNSLRREQKSLNDEAIKQAEERRKAEEEEIAAIKAANAERLKSQQDAISGYVSTLRDALKQTEESEIADIETKYNQLLDVYRKLEEPVKLEGESEEDFQARMAEYKALMLQAADIEVALEEQKQAEILAIKEKYESEAEAIKDKAAEDERQRLENELNDYRNMLEQKMMTFQEWSSGALSVLSSLNEITANMESAELQRYEDNNEKKKEELEARLQAGVISQEEYDYQVQALDEQLEKKQAEMELRQAKRDKALALAQAIINTALAITNAVAQNPMFGGLPGSAIAAAVGAVQIAAIASQPLPQASKGMLLNGPSHARGGIPIEAEGGEAIINKKSTAMYKPLLSAINQAGGGVKFASGGIPGQASVSVANGMREMGIATAEDIRGISNAIANMKIYTAIKDVNDGQSNFARIMERTKR